MSNQSNNLNKTFEDALQLLDDAAREKGQELQQLVGDKYAHIKAALRETTSEQRERLNALGRAAGDALKFEGEQLHKVAAEVDQQVKQNPWPYIGGVAVGALLLGYILGTSKNDK